MHDGNVITNIADHIAALGMVALFPGALIGWLIRRTRGVYGIVLYVAAALVGIDIWIWSIVTLKSLWGTAAVIVGLLFGIVGVIPLALIASLFCREWVLLGLLIINIAIIYLMKFVGASMLASHGKRQSVERASQSITK